MTVVDARDDGAFLGWPDLGTAQGGHVPGARQLSARLPRPAGRVVVVDDPVAEAVRALGGDADHLGAPFAEWATHRELPLGSAPNWRALVQPAWVQAQVHGRSPSTSRRAWAVLHVGWQDPTSWRAARVPGARWFDTEWVEEPPLWNLVSAGRLGARLGALGIGRETTVVVYGDPTMAATRVVLALVWWGVEDVRLMNGGLAAWNAEGLAVESGGAPFRPAAGVAPLEGEPARPELVQSIADAREVLADPLGALVSVRSWDEHCGRTSGYADIAQAGRIPGDVWGHAGSDAQRMQDYGDPDGTLRSPWEVRELLWAPWGIGPEKRVSFYCGTGWRASQAWFVAWLLGWPRAGVYDGGWKEWTADPANPIARDEPKLPG